MQHRETGTVAAQTATDGVTVTDPNITASSAGSSTFSVGTAVGCRLVLTLATFTDPGGYEAPGEYTASIDWGDSTTTSGTIDASGGLATGTVSDRKSVV